MNGERKNLLLKNEINILIDNILQQEDELNKYLNTKNNQSLLIKISRNNERINSLSNLIAKESKIAEEKIKLLEEEIFGFQQQIVKSIEPKVKYNEKDLEKNLIKEKFLSKTINLHENEMNQVIENLKLLKEEKITISNELIDLMSLRESLEDIIKMRAKYIFKIRKKTPLIKKKAIDNIENKEDNMENIININTEENENININEIKVEYHDILNITSINKLCNFIYKIIATNIVSTFSSLLIELNLKNIISLCIENAFNKHIKNDSNITLNNIHNFIREISVNIVNYNIKISSIFIEPQFELLLKCIFKLFSIEKTINDGLKFVNNDYSSNKNNLKNKKLEIEKRISECAKQKSELEMEKNKIENDCVSVNNYLNKIKEIKDIINLKEIEIQKINEELNLALSVYQGQIDGLTQENINLENKYKNNDYKYQIEKITQQIDFLFKGIKTKINEINDVNQKDEFIKEIIKDINDCLDSNNNININYNIHTFNHKNLLNIDDLNINNDYNHITDDENEEKEDISDNELLSSYNSNNLNNKNLTKVYHKKRGNTDINIRLLSDIEKENIYKNMNKKYKSNNSNMKKRHHHRHYLKLSECFQFNN